MQGEGCRLVGPVSPEDQLAAKAASQALESSPPPSISYRICFAPVLVFVTSLGLLTLLDLQSVYRVPSWCGLFRLEEDLLCQPEDWHLLARKGGGDPSNLLL